VDELDARLEAADREKRALEMRLAEAVGQLAQRDDVIGRLQEESTAVRSLNWLHTHGR
jgi:hypothetical protein